MDFTSLQFTFTAVVVLTAAAMAMFFDYRWKQRQPHQAHRVITLKHSPAQPSPVFFAAPVQYAPQTREIPVEMASSSPTTPSITRNFQFPAASLPAVTIDTTLLERLTSCQPKPAPSASNTLAVAERRGAVPSTVLRGMVQQPQLEELIGHHEPFTGLVISIGINDTDSAMWHGRGLMQSVARHISGLLKESDFASRTAYDEFVVVCRGEQGAQPQRRLNDISERLWDYQLRGIGASSILFIWGAVQVQNQPLAEAIEAANERMRETKRIGRAAKSAVAHLQVV